MVPFLCKLLNISIMFYLVYLSVLFSFLSVACCCLLFRQQLVNTWNKKIITQNCMRGLYWILKSVEEHGIHNERMHTRTEWNFSFKIIRHARFYCILTRMQIKATSTFYLLTDLNFNSFKTIDKQVLKLVLISLYVTKVSMRGSLITIYGFLVSGLPL